MSWDSQYVTEGHSPDVGKPNHEKKLFNFNCKQMNIPNFTTVVDIDYNEIWLKSLK